MCLSAFVMFQSVRRKTGNSENLLCLYVCIYACLYICMYVCINICMYVYHLLFGKVLPVKLS